MTSGEKESIFKNGSLVHSSATPQREGAAILADELSEVPDVIKWPRTPELKEFEAKAEHIFIVGHYGMGELIEPSPTRQWHYTSAAERTQLDEMRADEKPGRARLMRKC